MDFYRLYPEYYFPNILMISYGIIGILCFCQQHFLILISKADVVGDLSNIHIYRVNEIIYLPFAVD